ncbi:MAG: DUF4435 domain-containing protein [Chitinophagaceae bacterium]|nr:DUF4435 domain-containing protein [Chitinophagaceae bacterium]
MLEFSDEPKRLVSTFLAYRNDIDIYTEDELKDKEFYKVLFSRLLDSKIKINDITPLGSKNTVIERCKNEPNNGRKKLFIIDGDIKFIYRSTPSLKNLYVLEGYCIENFLFDKESVINFIYLNCGTKSKAEIESTLEFEKWLNGYSISLIDLFLHYALVDYFGGCFTLHNIHKFHSKDDYIEELVTRDIDHLKKEILNLTTEEEYQKKMNELKSRWDYSLDNLMTIVSGKDYLIPILLIKTNCFKKSKAFPSLEEAKFTLVQICNLDRLGKLKSTIEAL